MGHHPGRDPFRPDRRRYGKLVEQRGDQVDTSIAEAPVILDDGKIRRGRQFAVDGREAVDFVGEIALVDESGPGRQLDQDARQAPFLAPDVEVMPGVFDRAMSPAVGREPLKALELIEGRRRGIDIDRVRDFRLRAATAGALAAVAALRMR